MNGSDDKGSYEVHVPDRIEKKLPRLPEDAYGRVLRTISNLAGNPRPRGCVKLKGEELWRIRVGDYRVIFEVDNERRLVTILKVAHRRESYR